MDLNGIITALVTPLDSKNRLIEEKMEHLVELQINSGIHGLLPLGGTGEYPAHTMEERVRTVKTVVRAAKKRVPVIAGILEPGLGEAIRAGRQFKENGADAVLLVTPYYLLGKQEGLIDYYMAFDREVDVKFLVYNIPYRTNMNISPETVNKLSNMTDNLVGIKECSPNLGQAAELIRTMRDKISVLSGEEFLAVSEMLMGAQGAVMASANLVPKVWIEMFNLAKGMKAEAVTALYFKYQELFRLLFQEMNPGPLKYAMKRVGIDMGKPSIPLSEPADHLKKLLDAELEKLGLL